MFDRFNENRMITRIKESLYFRKIYKKNSENIKKLLLDLEDKISRDTVKKIIKARVSWLRDSTYYWRKIAVDECTEFSFIDNNGYNVLNTENPYFRDEFFKLDYSNLVLADGGAYRGDTITQLDQLSGRQFKYIYAFEPLEENYLVCQQVISKRKLNDKVKLVKIGLSNRKEIARFENQGELADANMGQYVEICTDVASKYINMQMQYDVNFIKLDIEGKEKEVLADLREYISQKKPDLAVCIYHNIEDLWEIPLIIKNIFPEYKIYIRHNSNYYTETVCYASIKGS